MKLLTLILLSFFGMKGYGQKGDCKSFTIHGWHIVYNKYYKKYAVSTLDSSDDRSWLVKNNIGKYGIYADGWQDCYGYSDCGSKEKSLFNSACEAKKFIIEYYRKLKQDKWQ